MNVQTGKSGWHKRIHRDYNAVAKRTKLTDDITICEDANAKILNAAKSVILKKKKATVVLASPSITTCASSSHAHASSVPSAAQATDDQAEQGSHYDSNSF